MMGRDQAVEPSMEPSKGRKPRRKKVDEMPKQVKIPKPEKTKSEQEGEICHHCRTRSEAPHVRCSKPNCRHKLCRMCLLNRYGEDLDSEMAANVQWVCPKCRGGCGEGCVKSCCNCSTCRKSRKLEVTGKTTVKIARNAGFTNVHDYMVHLQTGETSAAIASRKRGRFWTSIDIVSENIPGVPADKPLLLEPSYEVTGYEDGTFFDELPRRHDDHYMDSLRTV